MFRFAFTLSVFLFGCAKNFNFSNEYKVRKISKDAVSKVVRQTILGRNKGIFSEVNIKNINMKTLSALFEKYPPFILENGESLSSIILSNEEIYTAFNKKIVVEAVFECISSDEKLFFREINCFDENGEHFLDVVLQNYGIEKFIDILKIVKGKGSKIEESFYKSLISFKENRDSIFSSLMDQKLSLVKKDDAKNKYEDIKEDFLLKVLVRIREFSDSVFNQIINRDGDNILSLSAKLGIRRVFDISSELGTEYVSQCQLINIVCGEDEPYYINFVLREKNFDMDEEVFYDLLLSAYLNDNVKIVEELIAYGFGYHAILLERSKLEKAKNVFKKIFFKLSSAAINKIPELIDKGLSLAGSIGEPHAMAAALVYKAASKMAKPLTKVVKKKINSKIDKELMGMEEEKEKEEELVKSLNGVRTIQRKLMWLDRVNSFTLESNSSFLSEKDRKDRTKNICEFFRQITGKEKLKKEIEEIIEEKSLQTRLDELKNNAELFIKRFDKNFAGNLPTAYSEAEGKVKMLMTDTFKKLYEKVDEKIKSDKDSSKQFKSVVKNFVLLISKEKRKEVKNLEEEIIKEIGTTFNLNQERDKKFISDEFKNFVESLNDTSILAFDNSIISNKLAILINELCRQPGVQKDDVITEIVGIVNNFLVKLDEKHKKLLSSDKVSDFAKILEKNLAIKEQESKIIIDEIKDCISKFSFLCKNGKVDYYLDLIEIAGYLSGLNLITKEIFAYKNQGESVAEQEKIKVLNGQIDELEKVGQNDSFKFIEAILNISKDIRELGFSVDEASYFINRCKALINLKKLEI